MKNLILVIFVIIINFSCSHTGKIYSTSTDIKQGKLNTYIYEPPTGLLVPEDAMINLLYPPFQIQKVSLLKKDKNFEFTIKVPDSISFVMMTIIDKKRKAIDNNSGKGYVIYFKNKSKEDLERAKLSKLEYYGLEKYVLKLNSTSDEIISQFDELYSQNPSLKEDKSYGYYLFLQCEKDMTKFKPDLINYCERMIKNGDETCLQSASRYYSWLKMNDRSDEIDKMTVQKYPKGNLAKENFYNDFYHQKDKTEKDILEALNRFSKEFNDSTSSVKDRFYNQLLLLSFVNSDTVNIKKYASLINNKLEVAYIYNNQAWELSGQDLNSAGKDLPYAERLSKQAVEIIKDKIAHPSENDNIAQLRDSYLMDVDTYALILYKLKNYDLAFQFQDEISKLDEINPDGKERLAAYAEKSKGLEFARMYIEKQLNSGVESILMINQLKEIYKRLNLPLNEFNLIKVNQDRLAETRIQDNIKNKLGFVKEIDFTLTNLEGKEVKLSDYKNKLIVLDFWATWCGPCRASFPKMQELVTKFKDKNIEFFFIDVWEKSKPADTKLNVAKFIKENKYNFNVLFDLKDEVVAGYKVNAIPTKILIGKDGNIIAFDSSLEELSALIDSHI